MYTKYIWEIELAVGDTCPGPPPSGSLPRPGPYLDPGRAQGAHPGPGQGQRPARPPREQGRGLPGPPVPGQERPAASVKAGSQARARAPVYLPGMAHGRAGKAQGSRSLARFKRRPLVQTKNAKRGCHREQRRHSLRPLRSVSGSPFVARGGDCGSSTTVWPTHLSGPRPAPGPGPGLVDVQAACQATCACSRAAQGTEAGPGPERAAAPR
jgi:hypothetical protein